MALLWLKIITFLTFLSTQSTAIHRFSNGFPKQDFYTNYADRGIRSFSSIPATGPEIEGRVHSKDYYSKTEEVVDENNDYSSGQSLYELQNSSGAGKTKPPTIEYEYGEYEDGPIDPVYGKGFWSKIQNILSPLTVRLVWLGGVFNFPGFRKIKSTATDDYYSNGTVEVRVPRNKKRRKKPRNLSN